LPGQEVGANIEAYTLNETQKVVILYLEYGKTQNPIFGARQLRALVAIFILDSHQLPYTRFDATLVFIISEAAAGKSFY